MKIPLFLLLELSFIIMSSNIFAQETKVSGDDSKFQLHFLKNSLEYYDLGKSDDATSFRHNLNEESSFYITEDDIQIYHWLSQTILLKKTFLSKLKKAAQNHKGQKLSKTGAFILLLEGKPLYFGVIDRGYNFGSSFPTLFLKYYGKFPMIIIRPSKTYDNTRKGYSLLEQSLKDKIERPKIKEFFFHLGKLSNNNDSRCIEYWLPNADCDFFNK